MVIKISGVKLTSGLIKAGDFASFVTTSGGTLAILAKSANWTSPNDTTFNVTFASGQARDDYFATGGQIRLTFSHTGATPNNQNASISNMLSNVGVLAFGQTTTTRSGTVGTANPIGYSALTTSFQPILTASGTGVYSNDSLTISARIAGPISIEFRIFVVDGADGTIDEAVDGTLTVYIDERRYSTEASPFIS